MFLSKDKGEYSSVMYAQNTSNHELCPLEIKLHVVNTVHISDFLYKINSRFIQKKCQPILSILLIRLVVNGMCDYLFDIF